MEEPYIESELTSPAVENFQAALKDRKHQIFPSKQQAIASMYGIFPYI